MKKQIMPYIIGFLIGAIVTTSVFLILKPTSRNDSNISEKGSSSSKSKKGSKDRDNRVDNSEIKEHQNEESN